MEIEPTTLLLYFAIWTVFYFYLSHYIARLSRDKWVEYIRSEESDEMLIEALGSVIDEIEDRMHDKLEAFQSSFFGSLGAASKKLDNSTGQSTIKAITIQFNITIIFIIISLTSIIPFDLRLV